MPEQERVIRDKDDLACWIAEQLHEDMELAELVALDLVKLKRQDRPKRAPWRDPSKD